MNTAITRQWDTDQEFAVRRLWGVCFVLILASHAGALWLSLHWHASHKPDMPPPLAAVMMMELAPLPVPPAVHDTPPPIPTPVQQPQRVATPVLPQPPARLPVQPITPNDDSPTRQDEVVLPAAPATPAETAVNADPVTAPPTAAVAPSPQLLTWQGRLLGRLQRFKRYPADARWHRQQGLPYVHFTVDRNGKVLSVALASSSGVATLDAEAVELIHRAEPLPPPPEEVPGDPVELVVPVEFSLR
ncbi:MAG TPA: TonB family protein [Candidatus Acidoferrum sp.]|nr:TonB family protein [Candidatus Acidoferrum sp.]